MLMRSSDTGTHANAAGDCETIRAEAFAAADGELLPHALLAIDAHLQRCTPCCQQFTADAVFQQVVRRAVTLDTAPQSLRDRVTQLLHTPATEIAPA